MSGDILVLFLLMYTRDVEFEVSSEGPSSLVVEMLGCISVEDIEIKIQLVR